MSIEGGLAGACLDITGFCTPDNGLPDAVSPGEAFSILREANVPLENLTITSDGNGVQPIKNAAGIVDSFLLTPINAIALEIKKAVLRDKIALEDILPLATTNAAKRLRIDDRKGRLEAGKDADIVLLDNELEVDTVYSRGKLILREKMPMVLGSFEQEYANISI